jgi:CrcB protein
MLTKLVLVGVAGGLGSAARYLLSGWAQRLGSGFPWGTLVVNAAGCVAIGALMFAFEQRQAVSEHTRLVLAAGFLGGFTTFSAFASETVAVWRSGAVAVAIVNVVGSVAICVMAVLAGRGLIAAIVK